MKTYRSTICLGLVLVSAIGSSTIAGAAPTPRQAERPRSPTEAPRAQKKKAPGLPTPSNARKPASRADFVEMLRKHSQDDGITQYTCPARLDIASGSTFGSGALAFTSAATSVGGCSSSSDLAPADARGGYCMECRYEKGVSLRRSAGLQNVCWVVPGAPDTIACEHTPPPPASQTCNFELELPTVSLNPLAHVSGDKEMWSEGNVFDAGSVATVTIDASLERGTGSDSGKLRLWVQARLRESAPDHTTFASSKMITLGDEHIANGSAADLAACFATYGETHPFAPITGHNGTSSTGNDWVSLGATWTDGPLEFSASCKLDSNGDDDGDVGCKSIDFQPLNVVIR